MILSQAIMQTGRHRLAVICLLGFSSGLPLALTDATLQGWLAVAGVDIRTIGLFSLVGLPYVLKFLWSPLLDRFALPMLGRRRGWMCASQVLLMALIASLALQDPARTAFWVALTALCIAFVSATQDIAIDAYRAEILRPEERGFGAGLSVMGYRVASLLTGAGALVLAERIGFPQTYACLALAIFVGLGATLAGAEPATARRAPPSLRDAVVEPFRQFFTRDRAPALLALVLLYKFGDALAGRLIMTFLIRELDFSLSEIGAIYKVLGLAATLVGAVAGGAWMYRLGLFRALVLFAALQALTNFGFMVLAWMGKSYGTMALVITLENLSGGMGTAAFVALLMALCDNRYTATQFALLTAVASIGRVLAGPPAGVLVDAIGWPAFFFTTVLLSVPAVFLLIELRALVEEMDAGSAPTA